MRFGAVAMRADVTGTIVTESRAQTGATGGNCIGSPCRVSPGCVLRFRATGWTIRPMRSLALVLLVIGCSESEGPAPTPWQEHAPQFVGQWRIASPGDDVEPRSSVVHDFMENGDLTVVEQCFDGRPNQYPLARPTVAYWSENGHCVCTFGRSWHSEGDALVVSGEPGCEMVLSIPENHSQVQAVVLESVRDHACEADDGWFLRNEWTWERCPPDGCPRECP
jgi:hypothetical protein